jgi:hypothetical protein
MQISVLSITPLSYLRVFQNSFDGIYGEVIYTTRATLLQFTTDGETEVKTPITTGEQIDQLIENYKSFNPFPHPGDAEQVARDLEYLNDLKENLGSYCDSSAVQSWIQ